MSAKDWLIIAGAAAAVVVMLRYAGTKSTGQADASDWALKQGNTGFPDLAYTGIPAAGGGVWI